MTSIWPSVPSELEVLADLKERVRLLEANTPSPVGVQCCSTIIPPLSGSSGYNGSACFAGQRYGDFSVTTVGRFVVIETLSGDPEDISTPAGGGGIPNICGNDTLVYELYVTGGLYGCTGVKAQSAWAVQSVLGNTTPSQMQPDAVGVQPTAGYKDYTSMGVFSNEYGFGALLSVDLEIDVGTIFFSFTMAGKFVLNFVWFPVGFIPNASLSDSIVNPGHAYGDTLWWNGIAWTRLAIGTAGQVMTVSAGGVPSWA